MRSLRGNNSSQGSGADLNATPTSPVVVDVDAGMAWIYCVPCSSWYDRGFGTWSHPCVPDEPCCAFLANGYLQSLNKT